MYSIEKNFNTKTKLHIFIKETLLKAMEQVQSFHCFCFFLGSTGDFEGPLRCLVLGIIQIFEGLDGIYFGGLKGIG